MDQINASNLAYLAFRLGPFIMVSGFMVQSLINWDMKGIVYLAGVLLACVANLMANSFSSSVAPANSDPRCGLVSLGGGQSFYSKFPISITIYSYTFWFLFVFILNLARPQDDTSLGNIKSVDLGVALQQNIPILLIFPLLMIAEAVWIEQYQCVPSWLFSVGAMGVGFVVGFIWGLIIMYTNSPNLQYIQKPGTEICSRPTKTLYRCVTVPGNSAS